MVWTDGQTARWQTDAKSPLFAHALNARLELDERMLSALRSRYSLKSQRVETEIAGLDNDGRSWIMLACLQTPSYVLEARTT